MELEDSCPDELRGFSYFLPEATVTHAEGVCNVVCVILLGSGHLEGTDCAQDRRYVIPGVLRGVKEAERGEQNRTEED